MKPNDIVNDILPIIKSKFHVFYIYLIFKMFISYYNYFQYFFIFQINTDNYEIRNVDNIEGDIDSELLDKNYPVKYLKTKKIQVYFVNFFLFN